MHSIGMDENIAGRPPVTATSYTCWNWPEGNPASSAEGAMLAVNKMCLLSLYDIQRLAHHTEPLLQQNQDYDLYGISPCDPCKDPRILQI